MNDICKKLLQAYLMTSYLYYRGDGTWAGEAWCRAVLVLGIEDRTD